MALWLLYCLIVTGALFGLSLTTIRGIGDIALAILLLPLLLALIQDFQKYLKLRRKQRQKQLRNNPVQVFQSDAPGITVVPDNSEVGVVQDPLVSDNNRRLFLKLIGSSGAMLFFMAIFSEKAHASFFGSMPGPGTLAIKDSVGNVIDPAEKQSTDGYEIAEVDDSGTDSYYGFLHQNGAWYITKESSTGAYRYTKGPSAFATAWTNRLSLTYDYFDNVF